MVVPATMALVCRKVFIGKKSCNDQSDAPDHVERQARRHLESETIIESSDECSPHPDM
jgi:hypothetical protein